MSKDYITTNELKKIAIDAGFQVADKNSKVSFFENGDHRATVHKTEECSFWIIAEWSNAETMVPLTGAILNYIKTPVSKRSPNVYKLKVEGTGLYLIHINKYEITTTTNIKAAKAYDLEGVSEARELAEHQGVVLREETV